MLFYLLSYPAPSHLFFAIKSRRKRLFAEGEKEICERSSRRPKGSFFSEICRRVHLGIRSGRATDEAGTLSEGEGRAKAQALGEGSSGLHAIEGYSKPPAGATRTAAGGFALAGVTQERER